MDRRGWRATSDHSFGGFCLTLTTVSRIILPGQPVFQELIAVVRGENDNRILCQPKFFQAVQDHTDLAIEVAYRPVVAAVKSLKLATIHWSVNGTPSCRSTKSNPVRRTSSAVGG